jgi:membrane protease YdiL (CAAX protease family)
LADGELLQGEEITIVPDAKSSGATSCPFGRWSDTQMRIFEVVLVCVVAFGGSLLASTLSGINSSSSRSTVPSANWVNSILHDGSSLGLLWYVLQRRSKTFSDLGLSWRSMDLGVSILIFLVALIASRAVYEIISVTGLTPVSRATSISRVTHHLFGGGITFAAVLVQFLNPFYEELIVRAYLMTEVKALTNSASKPIILSTLIQMSYHFYQGAPLAFSSGALFLVFSIYYSKTNRITPIILAHMYYDIGATLVYALRTH